MMVLVIRASLIAIYVPLHAWLSQFWFSSLKFQKTGTGGRCGDLRVAEMCYFLKEYLGLDRVMSLEQQYLEFALAAED